MESIDKEISLPSPIYKEALNKIIENQLKKSAENFDIIFSQGSKKGDNYMGIVYRIQVIEKGTENIKLSIIVKLPPENEARRNELMINAFFKRESDFYDKIYPIYKKFQEARGINVEIEGFHHVPICYKTMTGDKQEGIFLEDLKPQGFEMFDRLKNVTKERIFIVMKNLAKFHAIFYSIKDQNPNLIAPFFDIPEIFIAMCERENSSMFGYFDHLKQQALEVVNKSENIAMKEKIKDYFQMNILEWLKLNLSSENVGPYGSICHGDCWNNNMFFLNDESENPTDIRFLDFQLVRHASPVVDLVYYIFCCTTKSLRDKNYNDFLDVYYQEFSSFMLRLGSNAEILFPRKIFNQHLKKFANFGLFMAIIVLPIFTINSEEDVPDMDHFSENLKKLTENCDVEKDAFSFTTERNHDKFSERFLGLCEDMYNLGYLTK